MTNLFASRRRLQVAIRVLQVALGVTVAIGVWLIGFAPDGGTPDLVPDTTEQFSLDLRVVGDADASVIYAVEQRARPAYRIFSFDPSTGAVDTVFTVPEDAIIYGIDLDPTGSILAVAYSPDHALDGSGIWTLDVASRVFEMVSPVVTDVYLTDPEWSDDGSAVLATNVDRTTEDESLDVVSVELVDGQKATVVEEAVNPAMDGELLHYLAVDPETMARRSIGTLDLVTGDGEIIASGDLDLDHLVAGDGSDGLVVAAIETDDDTATLTLGTPASAHGNHDVPSTWWNVVDATAGPADFAPTTVYDADGVGELLVYVTREGLSIAGDTKLDLIESRALRFVTA